MLIRMFHPLKAKMVVKTIRFDSNYLLNLLSTFTWLTQRLLLGSLSPP